MQTVWTDGETARRAEHGGADGRIGEHSAGAASHGRPRRRAVAAVCCALALTMTPILSACGSNGDSLRDFLPHIDGQELSAAKGSCEDALLTAGRAATAADEAADAGDAKARTTAFANARNAWIAMAAACPDRFGEGTMRAALAAHASDAASVDAANDSSNTDGTDTDGTDRTAWNADLSPIGSVTEQAASVIALAQDRSAFGLEVIAARDGANADDTKDSEARRTVASLWAARAGTDPRLKVYQVTGLSDGSGKVKVGSVETNERAAVAMDAALEEIKGLTAEVLDGMDATARARAARVVVSDAVDAFAYGYPADEASVLGE